MEGGDPFSTNPDMHQVLPNELLPALRSVAEVPAVHPEVLQVSLVFFPLALPENRLLRHCSKSGDVIGKNPVVRSKSYNNPLLTPVAEYESEIGSLNGTASIRRHSVSEITSCLGLQGYSNLTTITDVGSKSSMSKASSSGEEDPSSILRTASSNSQQQGIFDDFSVSKNSLQTLSQSSSPETMVDQILESVDSDSEGIFIDFTRHCSDSPEYSREPNRQNVM
ncbi:PRR5 protein, partial [Polypterus senegalus]